MLTLGERILERLTALDISQAELARRVKLSQPTINGLIRGGSRSSAHLHKIARELRTTPAYLSGETDDPEADFPDEFLTNDEREFVELLRTMDSADRAALLHLAHALAGSPSEPTMYNVQPGSPDQAKLASVHDKQVKYRIDG